MCCLRLRAAFVACLSVACLIANNSVPAGTFRVSPVRLDIGAFAKSGVLTIQNDSTETAVVIQARTVKWTQRDGQDVTVPTNELIVNPPIFTLKPGAQQVVRIGARAAGLTTDINNEIAYRLILGEVPQSPSANFRGVDVALSISIPIFFAGKVIAMNLAPPQINARRDAGGKITVEVLNRGSTNFKILKVRLLDRVTQQPVAELDELRYVLADSFATRAFKPLPKTDYTLSVLSDRGAYTLDINDATPAALPGLRSPISDAKAPEKN